MRQVSLYSDYLQAFVARAVRFRRVKPMAWNSERDVREEARQTSNPNL